MKYVFQSGLYEVSLKKYSHKGTKLCTEYTEVTQRNTKINSLL